MKKKRLIIKKLLECSKKKKSRILPLSTTQALFNCNFFSLSFIKYFVPFLNFYNCFFLLFLKLYFNQSENRICNVIFGLFSFRRLQENLIRAKFPKLFFLQRLPDFDRKLEHRNFVFFQNLKWKYIFHDLNKISIKKFE